MKITDVLAAGCLALVASGCGSDGGDSDTPIKIALLAPKTGALEVVGASFERVYTAAIGELNDKGGVAGRDLELIVSDTATVAETAGEKLSDLIDGGAIAVVGPATSGEVTSAYPVAAARKVPIISPSSTAPALSSPGLDPPDDNYMFRNVPDDDIQGIAMAYFLREVREPAIDTVVVLHEDSPYGNGLKDSFKLAFENLGGEVDDEIGFLQNLENDEAAQEFIDLMVADNPTMTVLIGLEQDNLKLVRAWDNGGAPLLPEMEWFMTDGARSSGFLTGAPASMLDMCGTAPTFPVSGLAYAALQSAYESRYTDTLDDQVFAPNVWDAVYLLATALEQQHHDFPDEELGGEHLRDRIFSVSREGQVFRADQWRDIVGNIRNGGNVDYDGAAGPNDFDIVGQAVGPYEVWCLAEVNAVRNFDQKLFLEAREIQDLIEN
jgi:branched-chain amino acid transport system substrate-binding protein